MRKDEKVTIGSKNTRFARLSEMQPLTMDPKKQRSLLLRTLFPEPEEDDFFEVRMLNKNNEHPYCTFVSCSQPENLENNKVSSDNYYYTPTVRSRGGRSKADITKFVALWIDLDYELEEALAKIKEFELLPSVAISTGRGVHLLFLLREPVAATKVNTTHIERILKALARRLDGDPKATDASRLLRLPGTQNFKYDPPRDVNLLWVAEYRYSLTGFTEVLDLDESDEEISEPLALDVVERLRSMNIRVAHIAGDEVVCHCPVHSPDAIPSLFVNWKNQKFNCFHEPNLHGCGLDRLAAQIERHPSGQEFVESLSTILIAAEFPLEFLVDPLIVAGSAGFISGEPKIGKTQIALDLAVSLASGRPFLGKFSVPKRRRVLFIENEDGTRLVGRRLRKLMGHYGVTPPELEDWLCFAVRKGFMLDDREWVAALIQQCKERLIEVVFLDVLNLSHTGDENSARDMSAVVRAGRTIMRECGVSFFVLHHFRKSGKGESSQRGSQRMRGSSVLAGFSENSIYLSYEKPFVRVEHETKFAEPYPTFCLQLIDGHFEFMGEGEGKVVPAAFSSLKKMVQTGKTEFTTKELMQLFGKTRKTVINYMKELEKQGRVCIREGEQVNAKRGNVYQLVSRK